MENKKLSTLPSQQSSDFTENDTEEAVEKKIICKIEDESSRSSFESVYQKYRVLLNRREDNIQSLKAAYAEVKDLLREANEQIETNNKQLTILEKKTLISKLRI